DFSHLAAEEVEWIQRAVDRSGPYPQAAPEWIGKYRVLGWLADGGQATTYRADDPQLQRSVVVKLARAGAPSDPMFTARILQEGRTLAELRHENLVQVFDMGVHDSRVFLVLENISGSPLSEYAVMHRCSPLRAAALVAGAARGLGQAHRHGINHLDVTPANIL